MVHKVMVMWLLNLWQLWEFLFFIHIQDLGNSSISDNTDKIFRYSDNSDISANLGISGDSNISDVSDYSGISDDSDISELSEVPELSENQNYRKCQNYRIAGIVGKVIRNIGNTGISQILDNGLFF